MASEAARWLAIAERDLKAVRNNLLGPEPTTEVAAYHCQQAAEKLVKAALIAADIDPPRWHDIDGLVHLLPGDNQLRGMLFPLARFAPYAVAYRYPVPDPDVLPDIPTTDEVTAWLGELEHVMAAVAVAIGTS
jgi:HEPN domain-containing protein